MNQQMNQQSCQCDNCGNIFAYGADDLAQIPDLAQRLDPGGQVPAAECPLCGALAYPVCTSADPMTWQREVQGLLAVIHRATRLLAGRLAGSTMLPIVEPSRDAPVEVRAMFKELIPGSVAVAIQRVPLGAVEVYYEGGLYTRGASRPAIPEERREYAITAASRAVEHYPTCAKFSLPSWSGLQVVGQVNTAAGRVWWVPALVAAPEGA